MSAYILQVKKPVTQDEIQDVLDYIKRLVGPALGHVRHFPVHTAFKFDMSPRQRAVSASRTLVG